MPAHQIHGVELSYTDRGLGAPLVLLHGFPLDGRVWDDVADLLEAHYRVIAPDLRGFGRSSHDGAFTIESLADDVHELLHALGIQRYSLGGLSMGGYVALAYAKKYGSELRELLLIDTKAAADTEEAKQGRMRMIETARSGGSKAVAEQMFPKMVAETTARENRAVSRKLRSIMQECPAATIERALLAMRDREDFTALLPKLGMPVLVIVGEGDAITSPDMARSMHLSIPGSKLALIAGAGHMSPIEQPQAVADAVQRFLGLPV